MSLLAALFGPLLSCLAKWWLGGRAVAKATRAANDQAKAEAHSGEIRDQAVNQLDQARTKNADAIEQARAAADRPDGLREQSAIANAAIDAANREVR